MYLASLVMVWTIAISLVQEPSLSVFTIDEARSKIEISVFRGGLLKLAGHDHKITAKRFRGEVLFDPAKLEDSSVHLIIESGSLTVIDDPGESDKDRREVQQTMESEKVLNIKEFPQILFNSTGVSNIAKTGEDFILSGRFNLHGVEKAVTFPVHIHAENNRLRATGTLTIAQTDFGMKPITAALGAIRVKDKVIVKFDFLAERTNK